MKQHVLMFYTWPCMRAIGYGGWVVLLDGTTYFWRDERDMPDSIRGLQVSNH